MAVSSNLIRRGTLARTCLRAHIRHTARFPTGAESPAGGRARRPPGGVLRARAGSLRAPDGGERRESTRVVDGAIGISGGEESRKDEGWS